MLLETVGLLLRKSIVILNIRDSGEDNQRIYKECEELVAWLKLKHKYKHLKRDQYYDIPDVSIRTTDDKEKRESISYEAILLTTEKLVI
jgi:hypothetical protein